MPRPHKEQSERKDFDLRIPLTADQKELIIKAARLAGADMAAWARPIILNAAQQLIGSSKKTRDA
jgi:uncharacterized protein (DUF1778 family)